MTDKSRDRLINAGLAFGAAVLAAGASIFGVWAKLNVDTALHNAESNQAIAKVSALERKVYIERTDEIATLRLGQALIGQKLDNLDLNNTTSHNTIMQSQNDIKQMLRDHVIGGKTALPSSLAKE